MNSEVHHAAATQHLLHTLATSWHQIIALIASQPLMQLALAGIALVLLGGAGRRWLPMAGGVLRFFGHIGLIAALLGAILDVTQSVHPPLLSLAGNAIPETTLSGRETRVMLAPDGHFWLSARVNGIKWRFLVDTGATLTTLSPATARAAGISGGQNAGPVLLRTANGTATATLVTIARLEVGTITARRIDAVVAPGLGDTNVLGMNFLSALASWRVEGKTLILVPHHPHPPSDDPRRQRPHR